MCVGRVFIILFGYIREFDYGFLEDWVGCNGLVVFELGLVYSRDLLNIGLVNMGVLRDD